MKSKDYWDGLLDGMFPNAKGRPSKHSAAMQIILNRYWPVNPDMTISTDTVRITHIALPKTSSHQRDTKYKVRATHTPSGIWAESEGQRSEHRNMLEAQRKLRGYVEGATP